MLRSLQAIRNQVKGSKVMTKGMSDPLIRQFERDPSLQAAITQARVKQREFIGELGDAVLQDEAKCIEACQSGFTNFYDPSSTNPYVGLAAQGPWIVTAHGSVIYDTGGYGMLGLGHNPPSVIAAMSEPQLMGNIMTPSFSQAKFNTKMRQAIGFSRRDAECPYRKFLCLNSGSESVSLAMRISDVDARHMTAEDGPHPGRKSVLVSLKGSFHGRTDRPAMASDSSRGNYSKHLKTYAGASAPTLYTVAVNDVNHLKDTFAEIESKGEHVELMLMEPVMGEGNPGIAVSRDFYDEARKQVDQARSLLLMDSIQAGLRTTGALSIMDSPDFTDAIPPDFETFSKALNGGMYPLSVLALGPQVPEIYVTGLYGNTMTTNPRALDVGSAVLDQITPELQANIREMGLYMKEQLRGLQAKHPDMICDVTGTGLLIAAHLKDGVRAFGVDSVEQLCRRQGLQVIHGGRNALRFTPHFNVSTQEIDLICAIMDECFLQYKVANN